MLGNGINRAYGAASWDDLIRSIQTKELTEKEAASLKEVPYPLQPVILTEDHLGMRMKNISLALSKLDVSEGNTDDYCAYYRDICENLRIRIDEAAEVFS